MDTEASWGGGGGGGGSLVVVLGEGLVPVLLQKKNRNNLLFTPHATGLKQPCE